MARRESYINLRARADAAEKREDLKRQQRIATPKAYKPRPGSQGAFYRSLLVEDAIFKINLVRQNANALLTGTPSDTEVASGSFANLGLLSAVPSGSSAIEIRGTGRKPAMLRWYNADDTPVAKTTAWGTRYLQWGDKTGAGQDAQSHRSCPVGDASSPATFDGIRTVVAALITSQRKTQLLNTRGQMTLIPELGNAQID